jgi:N6-adenosine-specific RNA methylase IME4
VTRYRTIVADPPWEIGDFPAWHKKERRSARERDIGMNPTPYKTMTLDQIKALPVGSLAVPEAHLYLWTTVGFLVESYDVARRWGFEPQYPLHWCKAPMGNGMGGKYREQRRVRPVLPRAARRRQDHVLPR